MSSAPVDLAFWGEILARDSWWIGWLEKMLREGGDHLDRALLEDQLVKRRRGEAFARSVRDGETPDRTQLQLVMTYLLLTEGKADEEE